MGVEEWVANSANLARLRNPLRIRVQMWKIAFSQFLYDLQSQTPQKFASGSENASRFRMRICKPLANPLRISANATSMRICECVLAPSQIFFRFCVWTGTGTYRYEYPVMLYEKARGALAFSGFRESREALCKGGARPGRANKENRAKRIQDFWGPARKIQKSTFSPAFCGEGGQKIYAKEQWLLVFVTKCRAVSTTAQTSCKFRAP